MNLYPYQLDAVAKMNDMEFNKKFTKGALKGSPGLGKTYIVSELIRTHPILEPRPQYSFVSVGCTVYTHKKEFKQVINSNIVIVAPVNIKHWDDYLKLFNLSVFIIKDSKSLNNFHKLILDITPFNYNVVLVKNGTVTGKLTINYENEKKTKHIINVVKEITKNLCFSRVIYDDPDIVGLPVNYKFINAYFSWFVSATSKPIQKKTYTDSQDSIMDFSNTADNDNILKELVDNNLAVIINTNENKTIENPIMFKYIIVDPYKKAIDVINNLTNNSELVRMLSGGAIGTAAKSLGIESNNIEDILRRIFSDSKQNLYEQKEYLSWLMSEENSLEIIRNLPKTNQECSLTDLRKQIPLITCHKNTISIVETEIKTTQNTINKLENTFGRLKSGLSDGCPICLESFVEQSFVILNCCNKTICSICFAKATNIRADKINIIGKCPCCRGEINVKKNTIFVDHKMLNAILECDAGNVDLSSPQPPELKIESTKLTVLIEILTSNITYDRKQVPLLPGILRGDDNVEQKEIVKKFLIFVDFKEIINNVGAELKKNNLQFTVLNGRINKMDEIIHDFQYTNKINILIIDSIRYSSGINLQSASDIIIVNSLDNDRLIQCIGRAQRIGRIGKLNIHLLEYI